MKKNVSVRLALLALAVSIVLPVNSSVKHISSNRSGVVSAAIESGSPLPAPPPPGFQIPSASGSPLPAPPPPGYKALAASGSPLPAPPPPGLGMLAVTISGSPLPAPPPPGRIA
jgi:hypothetical protein